MTALPAPKRWPTDGPPARAPPPRGTKLRFIDLFAGLGGFHAGLSKLGHECVFASEINEGLRQLYVKNYPDMEGKPVVGDIRASKHLIPEFDLLCAGFPCQPFSKSGSQDGFTDPTDGTLFHEVLLIIDEHRPPYVFLENVGNFEKHDGGNTWAVVKQALTDRKYNFLATEHDTHGLVSPHHLGFPQNRERFFVVAVRGDLPPEPFPPVDRKRETTFDKYLQDEVSAEESKAAELSSIQVDCIDHWNALLAKLPKGAEIPSPLWGDQFGKTWPYEERLKQPANVPVWQLPAYVDQRKVREGMTQKQMLRLLSGYARQKLKFEDWKIQYIRQSRQFWTDYGRYAPKGWLAKLRTFSWSLQKLEWHGGPELDLWKCVLQFRPSGLRARRDGRIPALVAMTSTQVPIIGPKRRFLTTTEGKLLQGFPSELELPKKRDDAFAALGNAVHVGVITEIGRRFVGEAMQAVAQRQPVLATA